MMKPNRIGTIILCGAILALGSAAHAQLDGPPPWQRTESRDDCVAFDLLRTPLFGETHVHTTYSFDAISGDVRSLPSDAYDFAKGAAIDLPPYDMMGVAQRSAQLRRPLDFAAVTDHAETIGEVQICLTPGTPEYDDPICVDFRAAIPQMSQVAGPGIFAFGVLGTSSMPERFDFCGVDGSICLAQTSVVWDDTQTAAEEHYDRTDSCGFTTFVAYEWTGNPGVQNIHRNVIFRNDDVPSLPISYIEEPTPEGLHAALTTECLDAGGQCDALIIPHNSNLSNGVMFEPANLGDGSPFTAAQAASRAAWEPIVEITQHKGDSECKQGVLSNDELCGFEKWSAGYIGLPFQNDEPLQFTRNALKEGLTQEEALGVNPFMFGVIGATDTHNATPGLTNEEDYASTGALGTRDATPELMVEGLALGITGGIETNPGGLGVFYAEENSRDALFAAMRRREVYATSGTRPILRFFGGDYKSDLCDSPDFVETGYRDGVPMGGELGAVRGKKSPTFAVLAMKDPGGGGEPSTPLQRVQIIKGWIDELGVAQEQVFEVAGDPDNGATVDTSTCIASGSGFDTLCVVWEDPAFNPTQRAFYYARVVENPVCRWSTRLCNAQGIDCNIPATIPAGMEECCDYGSPLTIQERAWSSPIWYRPESFGKFKAGIKVKGGGQDTLKISAKLKQIPADLNPNNEDITVTVTDDDTIYSVTLSPGDMVEKKPGAVWIRSDKTGAIGGIRKASLKINAKGEGKFSLKTIKMALPNADLVDHFVETRLEAGNYTARQFRLWAAKGTSLKP